MPSEQELKNTGFTPEDYANDKIVEIWPDNLDVVNLFIGMSTQWAVSINGGARLDYQSIPIVMEGIGLPRGQFQSLFNDLRFMEGVALKMRSSK